jgi:hypothetical protein
MMTEPQPGAVRTRPGNAGPASFGGGGHPNRLAVRRRGLAAWVVLGVLAVVGVLIAIRSGFGLLWFVPYASVGTLLIVRRPGMPIGWLLLAIGWLLVVQVMPVDATAEQFSAGTVPWPLLVLSCMAGGLSAFVAFFLLAYLAMAFPSGRLPGGRWGRVARILLTAVGLLAALGAVGPTINVNLIGAPNGPMFETRSPSRPTRRSGRS